MSNAVGCVEAHCITGPIALHHLPTGWHLNSCQEIAGPVHQLWMWNDEKVGSSGSPADSRCPVPGMDRLLCDDRLHAVAMYAAENGILHAPPGMLGFPV